DEITVRLVTRHLPHQEQRRVAELHPLTRLYRERSNLFSGDLRHQRRDALGDLNTGLIELVLPQHAGQHRTTELQLAADVARRPALMSSRFSLKEGDPSRVEVVQGGHGFSPFRARRCLNRMRAGYSLFSSVARGLPFTTRNPETLRPRSTVMSSAI